MLARIVEDETRHAELAFRYLAWALRQGNPALADEVAALLRDEQARLCAAPAPEPLEPEARACLRTHGRVSPEQDRALRGAAFAQVIAPCFRGILAAAAHAAELTAIPATLA